LSFFFFASSSLGFLERMKKEEDYRIAAHRDFPIGVLTRGRWIKRAQNASKMNEKTHEHSFVLYVCVL
jgi:hypothetical protein